MEQKKKNTYMYKGSRPRRLAHSATTFFSSPFFFVLALLLSPLANRSRAPCVACPTSRLLSFVHGFVYGDPCSHSFLSTYGNEKGWWGSSSGERTATTESLLHFPHASLLFFFFARFACWLSSFAPSYGIKKRTWKPKHAYPQISVSRSP